MFTGTLRYVVVGGVQCEASTYRRLFLVYPRVMIFWLWDRLAGIYVYVGVSVVRFFATLGLLVTLMHESDPLSTALTWVSYCFMVLHTTMFHMRMVRILRQRWEQ